MVARLDALPARELPGGLRIAAARTRATRGKGLSRMDEMPPDVGLELAPCRSVHTFGMRFALDLIWLDRSGAVVRVDEAVRPRRFRTCLAARSVIEVRGGCAAGFVAAIARTP
ncbi:DUF192 domain-containing protein [Solirubrobacter sp. CPCC 204708]|uniref:DUF192 domain-containing protein n=1 Tax=Solirubrobacter deserti TaxID=2282478 RepID=A0ABT4RSE9_9ACTN|nr:DUF192 domain-containing protein [Solirubrobacter deserti]MBE2316287.1 DUF192 domain-containing protein [Solirubrobacter deserti]MDA0141494.1 DUF192 domain-containing protein [Solirubrobacter deserti]